MRRISRLRDRSLRFALALAVVLAAAGCQHPQVLKLHYLNGFVPGSHQTFHSAHIAIPPPQGRLASGRHDVGAIYSQSGNLERRLAVSDTGAVVQNALMTALADAGLHPIRLEAQPSPADLKPGTDLMLVSSIEQISVNKNFGSQKTVHGQVFTMESRFRIKFTLVRRNGEKLYDGEMLGTEQEPPTPVGGEIFLPLETDPAEALSVALSRAIGNLLVQPALRSVLPLRDAAAAAASPAAGR